MAQPVDQITRKVDPGKVVTLANHHPAWARPENSLGPVPSGQALESLTLVLARSPQSEEAFLKLLADQQDPRSTEFHRWLTPAETGRRFGLSARDLGQVKAWLNSQGLHVNWISPSTTFIGFGGNAEDIGRAFHTSLRSYRGSSGPRISVSSDPKLPEALAPVIKAVQGLYAVEERPLHAARTMLSTSPELTLGGGVHFLTPADFSTIYDIPSASTGAGQTIGIVGRSRVSPDDTANFQAQVSSSFLPPIEVIPTAFGGVDPGPALTAPPTTNVSVEDQLEATLDVSRAGSVATGAQILLVAATSASGGIGADAQYLVETTPVPAQVMSISFGACESAAGPSAVAYWDTLFQQAAAEGISVFVSSGDAGASGCDQNFATPPASPQPNSPNFLCSSSYATCVGGTEFNDAPNPGQYWNTSNDFRLGSALRYIPEGGWNEPLDSKSNPRAAASGGGVSSVVATPSWQQGTGVPTARAGRYTPDIAFSSSGHDGYFGCMAALGADCVTNSNGSFRFGVFSGTSAAAPSMAGIMALLDGKAGAGLGNLNPQLYTLAATAPTTFHDVTVATSGVTSCAINTPSMCNNSIPGPTGLTGGQAGYLVNAGYDQVTGLGSLDVAKFLDNFVVPILTPTLSLQLYPGAQVTSAQLLQVFVVLTGRTGINPSGTVTLTFGNYSSDPVQADPTAYITFPGGVLPVGTGPLTVTYTPDAASAAFYTSATATATVSVTKVPVITPSVTVSASPSPVTTGQTLHVQIYVDGGTTPNGGYNESPSGTVVLSGGGFTSKPAMTTLNQNWVYLDISGHDLKLGNDKLTAVYTPDKLGALVYRSASGSANVTVNPPPVVAPAIGIFSPNPVTTIQALTISIDVPTTDGLPAPTGSLTFSAPGLASHTYALSAGAATIQIPAGQLPLGNDTLTAAYTPDAASTGKYLPSTASTMIYVGTRIVPQISVGLSPNPATTSDLIQARISIATNPGFPAPSGTMTLSAPGISSQTMSVSSGFAYLQIQPALLAVGTDTLTVTYAPDDSSSPVYSSSSASATITVNPPPVPAFSITGTALTITAGATTGNTSTISIAASGGFSGSVVLAAVVTSGPAGALSPPSTTFGSSTPATIAINGNGTATLTVYTTAASSTVAGNAKPGAPAPNERNGTLGFLAAGASLACVFLFSVPARRIRWRNSAGAALLMVALSSGMLACGGGGGGSTTPATHPATTPGTYTITVTGSSGTLSSTSTVSLTVK